MNPLFITEQLIIRIDKTPPSMMLNRLFNVFNNIKVLVISNYRFYLPELIQKIHLPNLEEIKIARLSELRVFDELKYIKILSVWKLDVPDFDF